MSEERNIPIFESMLRQIDCGVILFDANGQLYFMNTEMGRLLGAPEQALKGYCVRQMFRHQSIRRELRWIMIKVYKEIIRENKREVEYMDRSGRHWIITITPADKLNGYLMLTVKDVSRYKELEQTAYRQDKLAMLGQIAAAIAHEIRNPLTSIRGFIQLLRPYLMKLGKDEYTRIILAEIDRANEIIYEFLNSSKPSNPQKTTISMFSLLKDVNMLSESEALMRGCEIVLCDEAGDSPLYVSIDVKQIKQVLLNMMNNAMDAISLAQNRQQGRIHIGLKRYGDFVHIVIRDNGKGMDRQTMKKLFDPFFTTKQSGTGLGLSVSERIIKNHGGSVSVSSKVDEGTEFVITLPLVKVEDSTLLIEQRRTAEL